VTRRPYLYACSPTVLGEDICNTVGDHGLARKRVGNAYVLALAERLEGRRLDAARCR
jgi:hypothetical protein